MYNNSVALTNTRFDMDADPGAADRMAAGDGEEEEQGTAVSINMYDNEMSMNNTVITVKP